MILQNPFIIGSRLLPAIKVGSGTLSLEFVGYAESRMVFRWYLDLDDGREFSEADLKSGVQGSTTQRMFESLLGFLCAAAESLQYRVRKGLAEPDPDSNEGLFPPDVVAWADFNADELTAIQMELQEHPGLLKDEED